MRQISRRVFDVEIISFTAPLQTRSLRWSAAPPFGERQQRRRRSDLIGTPNQSTEIK